MAYGSEFLEQMARILQREFEPQVVGIQTLSFTDTPAVALTVPAQAFKAFITLEADVTSTDTTRAGRFWEDGTTPTSTTGMPLGDLDTYEISDPMALANFKIIGIEASKTHKLNITYFR